MSKKHVRCHYDPDQSINKIERSNLQEIASSQVPRNHKRNKGLTLIEAVLALALSALIISMLMNIFSLNETNWKRNSLRAELIQQSRVAMNRMSAELRQAQKMLDPGSDSLKFETTNLVDSDPGVEVIRYWVSGGHLEREVDSDGSRPLAGYSSGEYHVKSLTATGLKLSGGNLTPLIEGTDSHDDAVAVELTLQMEARAGNGSGPILSTLNTTTVVKLRNKL